MELLPRRSQRFRVMVDVAGVVVVAAVVAVVGVAEAFAEERNSEAVDGSSSRFGRSACVDC